MVENAYIKLINSIGHRTIFSHVVTSMCITSTFIQRSWVIFFITLKKDFIFDGRKNSTLLLQFSIFVVPLFLNASRCHLFLGWECCTNICLLAYCCRPECIKHLKKACNIRGLCIFYVLYKTHIFWCYPCRLTCEVTISSIYYIM